MSKSGRGHTDTVCWLQWLCRRHFRLLKQAIPRFASEMTSFPVFPYYRPTISGHQWSLPVAKTSYSKVSERNDVISDVSLLSLNHFRSLLVTSGHFRSLWRHFRLLKHAIPRFQREMTSFSVFPNYRPTISGHHRSLLVVMTSLPVPKTSCMDNLKGFFFNKKNYKAITMKVTNNNYLLRDQSTHCGQISDRSFQRLRRKSNRRKKKKSWRVNHNHSWLRQTAGHVSQLSTDLWNVEISS